MTLAASVVQASMITPSRSYRDPHPPQPLQPTDRPLDHPTDLPQPAAVRRPPLGDVRLDPQPPQQLPGRLAVVPPVGVRLVGQLLRPARLAPDLGEVEHQRDDLSWSLALAPAVRIASGTPWRSTISVCFVPFFRRSTGLGPVASPPPKARTVTPSMITVSGSSLPALRQQPQQVGVEAVPDAGLLPRPEPAVGGPAGAAEFRRDVLPAGPGGQDEPDHRARRSRGRQPRAGADDRSIRGQKPVPIPIPKSKSRSLPLAASFGTAGARPLSTTLSCLITLALPYMAYFVNVDLIQH